MFHSIRWRLVASYVLLTLLTVSLVGVLALSLIKRYVEQQERDYLTANAEAVARQALPLMQPVMRQSDLHELASTASFLGNVQVRILNHRRQTLADSGHPTGVNELVWIVTGMGHQPPDVPFWPSIVVLPHIQSPMIEISMDKPFAIFEQLPPDTEFTVVRRVEGPWGNRFVFGARHRLEVMPVFPITDSLPLREALEDQAALRSEHAVGYPHQVFANSGRVRGA
jgi:hypothetical protein